MKGNFFLNSPAGITEHYRENCLSATLHGEERGRPSRNKGAETMFCKKCGIKLNNLNCFYVPIKGKQGLRYCIKCAREENIITLV
jgi:hypothetical protein